MAPAAAEEELWLEDDWAALDAQALASSNGGRAPPLPDGVGLRPIVSAAEMEALLMEALERFKVHGTGLDCDESSDAQWLQQATNVCLPGNAFQAGNIRLHHAAFQRFFEAAGAQQRKPVQRLLSWLRDGMPLEFCNPRAEQQQRHPRFAGRIRQVEQLLRQHVPAERVAGMLNCDEPQRIVFSNRISCEQHSDWVSEHIAGLLQVGTLRRWPAEWPRPDVVSGLGVVPKAGGKLRLILDCRYLNLFVR